MKHVFVETNFLVDLLRPFPVRDAATLFNRIGTDATLHVPWVSISEAKRTIASKIIRDDFGFADFMGKFSAQLFKSTTISSDEMKVIQAFEKQAKNARYQALAAAESAVDGAVAKMNVIPPSQGVIAKTMALYPIKSLPPFDEMVLGAVLFGAQQLFSGGERDLFFCNANKNDFGPTSGNTLGAAYSACGLQYLADFKVP